MKKIEFEYFLKKEDNHGKRKRREKATKTYTIPDTIVGDMSSFSVDRLPAKVGKEFIKIYHYSHGIHNGPMTYGLFDGVGNLIGTCAFATPCSENVRSSVFGPNGKGHVTELHRLAIYPNNSPKGTATWFIARALKLLQEDKPHIRAIISFADSSQGHRGVIYRASNFLYCGMTGKATFYRDENFRLRHPRQCGVNIDKNAAKEMGWTPEVRDSKYRYLLLLGLPPSVRHHYSKRIWKKENAKFKKLLFSKLSPRMKDLIAPYPEDKPQEEENVQL